MEQTEITTWGPQGRRASVSVTFDNLGEACDINMGRWPVAGGQSCWQPLYCENQPWQGGFISPLEEHDHVPSGRKCPWCGWRSRN
jgi:hypothetical protein